MKKFLSLLLAAMLCVCALTPAMAETATEEAAPAVPFAFTLDTYKTYFDLLAAASLGVAPEWVQDEEGVVYANLADTFAVIVNMDENGNIFGFDTAVAISLEADEEAINAASETFGMIVALIGMSALTAEDVTFLANQELQTQFSTQIMTPLLSLIGNIASAMTAPIFETAEVSGHTCTFMMAIDQTAMTMTMGFTFEP